MTKKTAITLMTIMSATAIGVATGFSQNSQRLLTSKADDSVSWYHYRGTPATFTSSGIKDYWTDCKGTTMTMHPGKGAVIGEHRDIPETTVITSGDSRYLSQLNRSYNFEDGVLPDVFSNSSNSRLSISDTEGFASSKCLDISFLRAGDYMITMDKSYYDAVFADPSIVSIDFDARSNFASSNFRYTQNGTNTCYEFNSEAYGHGLSTTWKTFHYTREMYNALCNDQTEERYRYTLLTGAIVDNANQHIYVDNIRYSRIGGDLSKKVSFNESTIRVSGSDFFVLNPQQTATTGFLIKINSANVSSIELVDSVHMEGTRALKIHKDKGGYACLVLNSTFMNAVPADGSFLFDMYIENISGQPNFYSGAAAEGTLYGNNTALPLNLDGGKFYTISIPKSLCTTDNRFLYFSGSQTIGDIYLDNFRIATPRGDFDYDFESGYSEKTSDTSYAYRAKNNTNSSGYNVRLQVNAASSSNLNVAYGGLSTEFVSQGDYSFKFTKANGYVSVFLPGITNQLLYDSSTISFDLYSTVAANGTVGNFQYGNGTDYPGSHPANTWKTYTFTKSQITSDGRLFILKGGTAGDWYIDNIVINNEQATLYGFESGVTDQSGTTFAYRLASGSSAKLTVFDAKSIVSAFELSSEQANEGNKSLKITKNGAGDVAVTLVGIQGMLTDSTALSFDLYTTCGLNSNSTAQALTDGMNGKLGETYVHPANTWTTYTFTKSKITSDGRFLIFKGSPTFDAYIDNIIITEI